MSSDKKDTADPKYEENLKKLLSIGLKESVAKQQLNNKKLVATVLAVLEEAKIGAKGCDEAVGNLLNTVATKWAAGNPEVAKHRPDFLQYIVEKKIRSVAQVDHAIKYFKKSEKWDTAEFEKACGVGIVVTDKEIATCVANIIAKHQAQLQEERYQHAFKVLAEINEALKWAEGKKVKEAFDSAILAALGPRTEEDAKRKPKAKPAEDSTDPKDKPASTGASDNKEFKSVTDLPDDFLEARDIPWARNTPEQLAAHMKATGGRIQTRFPPEPNGYLHIGHCKSMAFNFGLAKKMGGNCIMRFDDTNPDAEKDEYIQSILENVAWMGHKQSQTNFSSDWFPQLYDLAVQLIKKGKAYVCHMTKAEIDKSRKEKTDSPYRKRSVEENLKLFEDMKKGKYEEGKATLRMKGDMKHPNPQMWDVIAYRIKYTAHPHVGDRWCIYPSYDYSHCIIDSLENITHSLCTLEFEVRRESYFWLLWELDIYKPKVWEYSRLNIEYNVLSKRRLLKLVGEHHVRGWDDPRLLTINGLRRRGYTAKAINNFCDKVGVSRTQNSIPDYVLEGCLRDDLEPIALRAMAVTQPLKVILTNWPKDKVEMRQAPNHPKDDEKGQHDVPFSRVLYIERSDFRVDGAADKSYYGLAPGKEVHLKYAYNIKCNEYKQDAKGEVTELHCSVDLKNETKCKGKIHWVAEPAPGKDPQKCELRLYDRLFMSQNPMAYKGDWLQDVNPDSLKIVTGFCDPSLASAKPGSKWQFERVAFFNCDDDTKEGGVLVFNRSVPLKESKEKPKAPSTSAATSSSAASYKDESDDEDENP